MVRRYRTRSPSSLPRNKATRLNRRPAMDTRTQATSGVPIPAALRRRNSIHTYLQPSRRAARAAPEPFPSAQHANPAANPYAPQQPAGYDNGYGYQPEPSPAPALRGAQYDQWAAAPAPAPSADPRGYDLASYMPPQGRTQPPQAPAQDYGHLTADLATHPQPGYSDWGHQSGYQQQPQGYAGQQGFDAHGYAQPGYDQQAYADPNAQGYDDDNDYEPEQPVRSRKWLTVAGALVGAIVIGGGLTYAYQTLLGDSTGGPTPIVKSAEGPSKVKPSTPGGKQFANTDSKLLGRLGEGGDSSASASRNRRRWCAKSPDARRRTRWCDPSSLRSVTATRACIRSGLIRSRSGHDPRRCAVARCGPCSKAAAHRRAASSAARAARAGGLERSTPRTRYAEVDQHGDR